MRILVVDDHPLFRDGITSLLEAEGYSIVEQLGNGLDAIDAVIRLEPDVVLMDITMPGCDGLQALQRIKAEAPKTKVVMLTASEDDNLLVSAMRYGAHGYIPKSMSSENFLANLERLAQGELAINGQEFSRIVEGLLGLVNQSSEPSDEPLTPREVALLNLVADGLSNKAIAQRLSISENTVKYHIRQILQKLNAQNRTEAAMMAIQAGIINNNRH